jgi:hypothetical protein
MNDKQYRHIVLLLQIQYLVNGVFWLILMLVHVK